MCIADKIYYFCHNICLNIFRKNNTYIISYFYSNLIMLDHYNYSNVIVALLLYNF